MKSSKTFNAIIFNIFFIIIYGNGFVVIGYTQNYLNLPYQYYYQYDNPTVLNEQNGNDNHDDHDKLSSMNNDFTILHDNNYDFTLENNNDNYYMTTYKNVIPISQEEVTTISSALTGNLMKGVGFIAGNSRKPNFIEHLFRSIGVPKPKAVSQSRTPSPEQKNDNLGLQPKVTTGGLDLQLPPIPSGLFDSFTDKVKAIYPGTVWCGGGDSAKSDKDIGLFFLTDHCCKVHDKCPKFIPAGTELLGLKNIGVFTRSHCSCDSTFYNCLKRTDSFISNKVGYTYFNLLSPQCFREEYPIIGCDKRQEKKCLSYIIDETKNKTWQWFDNNFY